MPAGRAGRRWTALVAHRLQRHLRGHASTAARAGISQEYFFVRSSFGACTIRGMTAIGGSAHGFDDSGLVLVLNSGSSSVKFAVLAPASGQRVLAGMAEKVGTPETELRIRRYPGQAVTEQLPECGYQDVISRILGHLPEAGSA